jgi:hypothetical protein
MVVHHLSAPAESVILRHQPALPFRAAYNRNSGGPASSSPTHDTRS